MTKRQISSAAGQVEYQPGAYCQVSSAAGQVEYQPGPYRQVSAAAAMVEYLPCIQYTTDAGYQEYQFYLSKLQTLKDDYGSMVELTPWQQCTSIDNLAELDVLLATETLAAMSRLLGLPVNPEPAEKPTGRKAWSDFEAITTACPEIPIVNLACVVLQVVNLALYVQSAIREFLIVTGRGYPGFDAVDAQTTDLGVLLTRGLLFNYDRMGAAQYATTQSQNNFNNFPVDGSGLGFNDPYYGNVGTGKRYTCYLDHVTGTGSSTWISEVLHFGGKIPMTNDPANPGLCDVGTIGTYADKAWRYCPNPEVVEGPNGPCDDGYASRNWRDHRGLARYFASFANAGRLDCLCVEDDLQPALHIDNTVAFNVAGDLKSGGDTYLSELFTTAPFNTLETGDWIFTCLINRPLPAECGCPPECDPSSEDSSHSFIIVGWGAVVDTIDGLNAMGLNLSRDEDHPIPYIADFCFGTDAEPDDVSTGWLQDPRPRPFYTCIVDIPRSKFATDGSPAIGNLSLDEYMEYLQNRNFSPFVTANGDRPILEFYKLPSQLRIHINRLFH